MGFRLTLRQSGTSCISRCRAPGQISTSVMPKWITLSRSMSKNSAPLGRWRCRRIFGQKCCPRRKSSKSRLKGSDTSPSVVASAGTLQSNKDRTDTSTSRLQKGAAQQPQGSTVGQDECREKDPSLQHEIGALRGALGRKEDRLEVRE